MVTLQPGSAVDFFYNVSYNKLMGSKLNPSKFIGNKYHRLTVVSVNKSLPRYCKGKQYGYRYYLNCVCECGTQKSISHLDLISSKTKSCGCLAREIVIRRSYKHGMSLSPTWRSWSAMISRCYTPTSSAYYKYGAKGVKVCKRWRDSVNGFKNFYKDMGSRPNGKSIDRINGKKGYYPSNCRWASSLEQSNNQKSNVKVSWQGKEYNISQLMRKLGLYTKSGVYYSRLNRGWTPERTFSTPIKSYKK